MSNLLKELEIQEKIEGNTANIRILKALVVEAKVKKLFINSITHVSGYKYGQGVYDIYYFYYINSNFLKVIKALMGLEINEEDLKSLETSKSYMDHNSQF